MAQSYQLDHVRNRPLSRTGSCVPRQHCYRPIPRSATGFSRIFWRWSSVTSSHGARGIVTWTVCWADVLKLAATFASVTVLVCMLISVRSRSLRLGADLIDDVLVLVRHIGDQFHLFGSEPPARAGLESCRPQRHRTRRLKFAAVAHGLPSIARRAAGGRWLGNSRQ